jgi:uncharacterized protein YbjT (DUF2867 family)
MTENVILVTGATGNVGRQVVSQLSGTGAAVRALTRDPDIAALPSDVEVVRGDFSAPETLDAATEGVEAVFLVWPFITADRAPAVVDAIARHASRIVYLSSMGMPDERGRKTEPISFHAQLEELIQKSGREWTFLRPGGFATNTLMWAPQIRAGDVVRWPYGAASRSLIHEADIAAVAVHALTGAGSAGTGDSGHSGGETYLLTGPELLTRAEQVRTIGEVIGRPLRWEELSRDDAREQLLAAWGESPFIDSALDAWAAFVTEPEVVTSTVEGVTGRPARTLREWAADHAADFR